MSVVPLDIYNRCSQKVMAKNTNWWMALMGIVIYCYTDYVPSIECSAAVCTSNTDYRDSIHIAIEDVYKQMPAHNRATHDP